MGHIITGANQEMVHFLKGDELFDLSLVLMPGIAKCRPSKTDIVDISADNAAALSDKVSTVLDNGRFNAKLQAYDKLCASKTNSNDVALKFTDMSESVEEYAPRTFGSMLLREEARSFRGFLRRSGGCSWRECKPEAALYTLIGLAQSEALMGNNGEMFTPSDFFGFTELLSGIGIRVGKGMNAKDAFKTGITIAAALAEGCFNGDLKAYDDELDSAEALAGEAHSFEPVVHEELDTYNSVHDETIDLQRDLEQFPGFLKRCSGFTVERRVLVPMLDCFHQRYSFR